MQVPSVRRMVCYWSYGSPDGTYKSEDRAAVITESKYLGPSTDSKESIEHSYDVSLCVINPTGLFFTPHVKYSEVPKPGCYSWPMKL